MLYQCMSACVWNRIIHTNVISFRSGKDVSHEYFYQVLADKDVECVLPSVEELLKKSFHESNLKLTEVGKPK